ncbi:hypothetical protein BN10_300013 [Phycicoccus elongatus Lp2]|uniref:Uncharacterized protein n=1 Tax=Phycicoccus elongatus Lp2 TaxID=1193181 RepID=N0DYX2_9MICO|nr:hypothetical protein BN10_300013 [Phycicoccus elongatus Lp2]
MSRPPDGTPRRTHGSLAAHPRALAALTAPTDQCAHADAPWLQWPSESHGCRFLTFLYVRADRATHPSLLGSRGPRHTAGEP